MQVHLSSMSMKVTHQVKVKVTEYYHTSILAYRGGLSRPLERRTVTDAGADLGWRT